MSARATVNSTEVSEELSDLGNARRFINRFGELVRWVAARGEWIYYNGSVWTPDQTLQIERFGQMVVQEIFTEAATDPDPARRKEIAKHAMRSQSARAIRDLLQLARAHLVVMPGELDTDRYVLAVQNGVLDLRTGELRPHRREDMITKLIPVPYDPAATCPIWDAVLERIMGGRKGLIAYVQRIFGYSLSGDVREQSLYVFHGSGGNGKSTIVNTIMELLGPHAAQLATDVLLARGGDAMFVLNQLASIESKRLVAATEADLGRRLAESLIKQLCGGDRIKVRRLWHEPYDIDPTWKIILSTNHKPAIRGSDIAIWRRVKLVPFTVSIPDDEQDRHLPEKLRAELPGILAWCVRGAMDWQRQGLGAPDEVRSATAAYKAEEDTVMGFLAERCVQDPVATVPAADLYRDYVIWVKDSGETPMTKRDLGLRLAERGFAAARTKRARQWAGLRLRSPMDSEDGDGDPAVTQGDTDSRVFPQAQSLTYRNGEEESPHVTASPKQEAAQDFTSDCEDPPEQSEGF